MRLVKAGRDLILQSDDDDFFRFCSSLRESLNDSGVPVFRLVADLNRYYRELNHLAADAEQKRREAVQRYASGQTSLGFAPEPLVAKFLKSRRWGDPQYLPLKTHHFDIFAATLFSSHDAVTAQVRLQSKFPASKAYADRVGELLRQAFGTGERPVQGYLRLADALAIDFNEVAAKLLAEVRHTEDLFKMLALRGAMPGDIGFPYLIDAYRRYAEWMRPLLAVLSEAVCLAEERLPPDSRLGLTKSTEHIRKSSYGDILDCLDPRIRHAASHNAISYDQDRGVVEFGEVDAHGNISGRFELTYAQVSEKAQALLYGLVPGLLAAFGMRRQSLLLLAIQSADYLRLLLLIDNEAGGADN